MYCQLNFFFSDSTFHSESEVQFFYSLDFSLVLALSSWQALLASYLHEYHNENDEVIGGAQNMQVKLSNWEFWILTSNQQ